MLCCNSLPPPSNDTSPKNVFPPQKAIGVALLIITGIGCLLVAAIGMSLIQGWSSIGALSNISQMQALVMLTAGAMVGSATLSIALYILIKHLTCDNPNNNPSGGTSFGITNYPTGLINLTNTCYMNSVLQALTAIPEIQKRIEELKSDNSLADALHQTLETRDKKALKHLQKVIFGLGLKEFGIGTEKKQKDAAELLILILDSLQWFPFKEWSSLRRVYTDQEPTSRETDREESNTLQLSLRNYTTYEEALNGHFLAEQVDDLHPLENQIHYEKRVHITPPDILVTPLARFIDMNNKLEGGITFPEDDVVRLRQGEMEVEYEIIATVNHHGSTLKNGHYTADIKYSSGTWLHYDDAKAVEFSKTRPKNEPYIVFLRKKEV